MRKATLDFHDQTWEAILTMAEELPSSRVDVIRDALSLYWWLFREHREGSRLLIQRGSRVTEVFEPKLEAMRERYKQAAKP